MIKWIMKTYFKAKLEAQEETERKREQYERYKEKRLSTACPSCKEVHTMKDLKGRATRTEWISPTFNAMVNFINCPKCNTLYCLVYYKEDGEWFAQGYSLYNHEDDVNV